MLAFWLPLRKTTSNRHQAGFANSVPHRSIATIAWHVLRYFYFDFGLGCWKRFLEYLGQDLKGLGFVLIPCWFDVVYAGLKAIKNINIIFLKESTKLPKLICFCAHFFAGLPFYTKHAPCVENNILRWCCFHVAIEPFWLWNSGLDL